MISKLPRWVWAGGWVLAFNAGLVNVVGLLGFEHLGVSHMTATTSRLGVTWVEHDYTGLAQLAGLIGSFVIGATISGAIVRDPALRIGRRYGVALLLESAMLCAAALFLRGDRVLGVYFAACACGLQNAMASTYSHAIVRTTHVTGMFTDIGIILGQRIDGRPADWRRFQLNTLIILGFIAGAMVGTFAYQLLSPRSYLTLLIPAAITGSAALAYSVYRARMHAKHIATRHAAHVERASRQAALRQQT